MKISTLLVLNNFTFLFYTEEVKRISESVGLRINTGKCKITVSNDWEDGMVVMTESSEVDVDQDCCYLYIQT